MGMRVDETRREGLAGSHHLAVGAGGRQVAHCQDAVAADPEVAGRARPAGAVEQGGVADDEVAAERHGGFVLRRKGYAVAGAKPHSRRRERGLASVAAKASLPRRAARRSGAPREKAMSATLASRRTALAAGAALFATAPAAAQTAQGPAASGTAPNGRRASPGGAGGAGGDLVQGFSRERL